MIFYFPKFYNFLTKRVTGGLFDYYGMVLKERKKNKKKRRYSSQLVNRHHFYIKSFVKRNLQIPRFFQIHRGTRQRRIPYMKDKKKLFNAKY